MYLIKDKSLTPARANIHFDPYWEGMEEYMERNFSGEYVSEIIHNVEIVVSQMTYYGLLDKIQFQLEADIKDQE